MGALRKDGIHTGCAEIFTTACEVVKGIVSSCDGVFFVRMAPILDLVLLLALLCVPGDWHHGHAGDGHHAGNALPGSGTTLVMPGLLLVMVLIQVQLPSSIWKF